MEHHLHNSGSGTPTQPPFLYYPFLTPPPFLPPMLTSGTDVCTTQSTLSPGLLTTPLRVGVPSTSNLQSSNFSINRLLEQPTHENIAVSLAAAASPPNSTSATSLPLVLHQQQQQQHKALMDTASKLLWLQQLASAGQHNPFLPRQAMTTSPHNKKVAKKRKLGRNPRIPFTQQQINCLERKYCSGKYLSSMDVMQISKELGLAEARVKIWFQNRRARERRDKRTDDFTSIPSSITHCTSAVDLSPNSSAAVCVPAATHLPITSTDMSSTPSVLENRLWTRTSTAILGETSMGYRMENQREFSSERHEMNRDKNMALSFNKTNTVTNHQCKIEVESDSD